MARFLVKASEFKNVCKAVNDRKLAELKKEIIEILKKQDEKEVKKAVDYFNSQELHYTHLEKSLVSGKWIEKAGYGVGTVRIWKGKKYKKIAPGKWARVFDKEGRGTNIAIGKLIARVNKIDNAEDLLQFVMENKQRFVDEDGRELGILDKVRAAVDTRNEKLSGESSPYVYGVGENVNRAKNEMFSKKDKITKEEADLHKVSRKLSQIPTTELKQEKARLERAVANKTRSKRDSLNNVIFRESNQKKLDAINKELEKRSNKVAEKKVDNPYDSMNEKEIDIEVSKELDNLAAKSKKLTIHEVANYIKENNKELYNNLEKRWGDSLISALADVAIDRKNKKDNESEKPAEKKTSFKQEMNQLYDAQDKAWEGFESGSEIKSTPENSKKFYDRVKKFVDDNNIKLSKKHYDEIEEMNGHSFNEALALAGAYGEDAKKKELARNKEYSQKYKGQILDLSMIDEFKESDDENKTYWIQDNRGNRLTNEDAKKKIIGQMKYLAELEDMAGKKMNNRLVRDTEYYIDYLKDRLNPEDRKEIESEAEKHQNRSDAMKGNKNAYKGGPKDVAKYINSQTNDDKERNSMLVEAFNERYGTEKDKDYAFYSMGELYNDVVQAKPHTDKWYDAMNKYNEAAEMYKMVIGDDEIDYYNREVEKIRMKPNWNKEKLSDSKIEKPLNNDIAAKTVSYNELKPIATNKSVGENEVQLPYSKDLVNEIESLKNCTAPKWEPRDFLKHVYYENGKLITTDARRMKFIEVGELEGIPNGSYVDINTDKSGINIKKIDVDARFPNYSKVIPEDLKQTATLDTKIVKDKIKEMYKDGAISKKGSNLVQLEFRDGKVFIDDTPVGEAKDIKMKYGEGWGPANEETNFMAINADYLLNALSGKTSVLQIGERADKAIAINTGSTSNILMPMSGSDKKMDYGQGRQAKKDANEKKSALKEAYKKTNEEYIASIKANYGERFKRMAQSAADNLTERMADMSDETLKLNYDRLKFNLDKVMDKKEYITEDTKVDNKLKLGLRDAILYQTTAKEHPEVIERFEEELEKRGITVKKSLFDDFVMDMFIDEDEEEIEEDEENESLFNDYSAVQTELFNSTEMKVREALDRINNQVL